MEIIVAKPPTVGKLLVTGSQKSLHYSIPVDFTRRSCTPSEVPNNSNKGLINPTQEFKDFFGTAKKYSIFVYTAIKLCTQWHNAMDHGTLQLNWVVNSEHNEDKIGYLKYVH